MPELHAELHELSAHELLAGYQSRAFSPVEVTQAVIAHVERWEPRLQATYLSARAGAGAGAPKRSALAKNAPCGLLDGVPGTLKENIATAGDPMPAGTAASLAPLAAQDAPPTARLREAGMVRLSKTTMPDWGMLSSGLSSFHRLARNPWDLARTPAAAAPAPAPQPLPATARCTWAPTSAGRCACRPAGAASSPSSPAWAACPSTRPTWAAPPAP
jgi:Asp-tRNA(Asn)/Glu-tRNA(Gln) amidotransferase A subunit family amidase